MTSLPQSLHRRHRQLRWKSRSQPTPPHQRPNRPLLPRPQRPTSLLRQARVVFRSLLAQGPVTTPLVPAKEWPGPEFPGLVTTHLLHAREWLVRVLRAATEQALVQVAQGLGVPPGLRVRARALRSNSVPVVPAVVAQAVPVAQVVPEAPVVPVAADQAVVGGQVAVVVAGLVVVRQVRSDVAARRASLGSQSGQSAKNLR